MHLLTRCGTVVVLDHVLVLAQAEEVALEHSDSHDSNGGNVDRRAVTDICLKVLLAGHVDADASVLEPAGGDLVVLYWDGRNDYVRDTECLLQSDVDWVDDVVSVVL